ncbi:uncharacterized protein [Lepisosteus oculatus]|uniref:uncharacterized protein n=1 Tax=Lepisosteus oculatus TaxID=7918 RepID=UPI0003EAD96C|nr:PREDICTED: polyubiquitin-like [Lepisosteus oculatus]
MGKTYQVIVVGIKGEKKAIDVGHSEEEMNNLSILEFKKRIFEKIPGNSGNPDELRLIYTDKNLEDSGKFSDYQIKDRSHIFVVLKLPGGRRSRRA